LCSESSTWVSKAAKLLEKVKNTKKYSSDERFDMMMDALDMDEDCLPCLQYLGNSSFKRAKRKGSSFAPAIQYYEKLIELCPDYHSNPYYALGASLIDLNIELSQMDNASLEGAKILLS